MAKYGKNPIIGHDVGFRLWCTPPDLNREPTD